MSKTMGRVHVYWPGLPDKPAGNTIACVGNYRPQGYDPHGEWANYVVGCRCVECLRARKRYYAFGSDRGSGIGQRYKASVRPNSLRALRFVDPLRYAEWRHSRAGGAWLLFYAVLLPSEADR